jgi:hypothetical protein
MHVRQNSAGSIGVALLDSEICETGEGGPELSEQSPLPKLAPSSYHESPALHGIGSQDSAAVFSVIVSSTLFTCLQCCGES